MTDPPADSIKRIADARRDAESELKKALSAVPASDDVAPYLPAITSFASVVFDAEAGELLAVCKNAERFEVALRTAATRIVEGILPEQSLRTVKIGGSLDGPHGDWERFIHKGVARLSLRFPSQRAAVRTALNVALQNQTGYWVGRFQIQVRDLFLDGIPADRAASSSGQGPRAKGIIVDDEHRRCVALSDQILAIQPIKAFLQEHRNVGRTQFTDYRAGKIKGNISKQKRDAIEFAIIASATQLGLLTRTHSD